MHIRPTETKDGLLILQVFFDFFNSSSWVSWHILARGFDVWHLEEVVNVLSWEKWNVNC